MASNTDAFTFIDRAITLDTDHDPPQLYPKFNHLLSAKLPSPILQLLEDLRAKYPDHIVTYVGPTLNLLAYAYAGNATATLDISTDSIFRMRTWYQPAQPSGQPVLGQLAEARGFAKYQYRWGDEEFILYVIAVGLSSGQFLLKEKGPGEVQLGHSVKSDALLAKIGVWGNPARKGIYVYDQYWRLDEALYEQVQKASWDKVILDPKMKKDLTSISNRFFDSQPIYADLGVPWKRGLIFYGPPGNGKTISIKALMKTLSERKPPVATLYVKSAPRTFDTRAIFSLARSLSPCMLILEDIDTIVTASTRSYFFNEVDGLENNDGILMVASTNHIEQLDPGLSKRPSRFDRKYLFPSPSKAERIQYVEYWRQKLKKNEVEFPKSLVEPIAGITYDFSFAYIQEAFVSSLLEIAHHHDDDGGSEDDEQGFASMADLEKYELWRVMNEQVKILRDEMDGSALGSASKKRPLPASKAARLDRVNDDEHHPSGKTESATKPCECQRYNAGHHEGIDVASATECMESPEGLVVWGTPYSTRVCPASDALTNQIRGIHLFSGGS